MMLFQGVAELQQAVGTHLGWSDWHEVTQQQVDAFADATGDHQWIHVDAERSARGPFGGTIAHGYLTLSVIPQLVWQVYDVQGVSMSVNYGLEKVRFTSPLHVGSLIRAGVELVSLAERGGRHKMMTRVTVEVEGGTRPVCIAETLTALVA